jgi:2-polyprenyl-6-methoxyphenol hydroxylase-like FAD-dependent oxidoreductase
MGRARAPGPRTTRDPGPGTAGPAPAAPIREAQVTPTATPEVLIAGAGPVGLTAAAELSRRGIRCRIVDALPARLPYARAVGIQPRTLEFWDRMGLARTVLERAARLRGQLVYADGTEKARIDLELPPEVPYSFAALPQYDTEQILEEYTTGLGTPVERGTRLDSFTEEGDGVTVRLTTPAGTPDEELRVRYLIGCDGAHSTVRKQLRIAFRGGAFPDDYMLADVEADWDLPEGYAIRSSRTAPPGGDGVTGDLLVCIPLPGSGRYRMSMLVPPGKADPAEEDGIAHGLRPGGRGPGLDEVRAVVDRLGPRPATLTGLRWSSVFRISHRIAEHYGRGRVLLAGDAAHIHPPTGAQGMNTGIQDAVNLTWKLALVLRGGAPPALLGTYDTERRPVGEEVVGRTVRHAVHGMASDPDDPGTLLLREAQLLVGYRGGPLAGSPYGPPGAPQPGDRAPDCAGLTAPAAAHPLRLLDVLRGRTGHVLILWADGTDALAPAAAEVAAAGGTWSLRLPGGGPEPGPRTPGGRRGPLLEAFAVLAHGSRPAAPGDRPVPAYHDGAGEFARLYRPGGPTGFLLRPDGHLAARFPLSATGTALAQSLTALGGVV